VRSRGRSSFRRFERWLVGVFMAVLVFVLERLVMHQIKKKEVARSDSSAAAVTLGEE
jgi:Mn2+/Fe2+ NRAMP family transporter